jgi:hypothetical protein
MRRKKTVKQEGNIYCSRQCAQLHGAIFFCEVCKKKVIEKSWKAKQRKYCSEACSKKVHRGKVVREMSDGYLRGIYKSKNKFIATTPEIESLILEHKRVVLHGKRAMKEHGIHIR